MNLIQTQNVMAYTWSKMLVYLCKYPIRGNINIYSIAVISYLGKTLGFELCFKMSDVTLLVRSGIVALLVYRLWEMLNVHSQEVRVQNLGGWFMCPYPALVPLMSTVSCFPIYLLKMFRDSTSIRHWWSKYWECTHLSSLRFVASAACPFGIEVVWNIK